VIPFFSRQIGLGEQTNEEGTRRPFRSRSWACTRVGQGRTYDVGLLAMRTGRDTNNRRTRSWSAGSARNLPGSSTIGALVTSRDSTVSGDYNRLYGVDLFLRSFQKLEVTFVPVPDRITGAEGARPVAPGQRDMARQRLQRWRPLRAGAAEFNPEVGFVGRGA